MKFHELKKYAIKKRFDQEINKLPIGGRFESKKDIVLDELQYEFFICKRTLSDILFDERIPNPPENQKERLKASKLFKE